MNTPTDYHSFCGPRAVAALQGRSAHSTAASLWHAQKMRGRFTAPGTPTPDMVLVLAADGHRITEHATARTAPLAELRGHDALIAELVKEFDRDRSAPPREPEPEPPPMPEHLERWCAKEAVRIRGEDHLTLAELLPLVPTGRWLFLAGASPVLGVLDHHVLAVADGRVIAGDGPELPAYRDAAIEIAYQIHSPEET